MAIITKPTIAKGQANEFDLSKSDLAVLSKVTSDSYFSDQANWSKVYIEYKSTEGKQHEMVIFDASETAPKGSFDISEKSKDDFEVQAVVIMDFDGGYLKLERGDLTVADFDISLSSIAPSLISTFSETLKSPSVILSSENMVFSVGSSTKGIVAVEKEIDVTQGGKYYFEVHNTSNNLTANDINTSIIAWFADVAPSDFNGYYSSSTLQSNDSNVVARGATSVYFKVRGYNQYGISGYDPYAYEQRPNTHLPDGKFGLAIDLDNKTGFCTFQLDDGTIIMTDVFDISSIIENKTKLYFLAYAQEKTGSNEAQLTKTDVMLPEGYTLV